MSPLIVEAAGFIAAASTLLLFIPQTLSTWRNRHDAHAFAGLSTGMIWLSFIGAVMWLIYGAGIGAVWTMIPSFINIPLTLFILFLIKKARGQARKAEEAR